MVFKKVAGMISEQFGVDVSTITMDTLFEEDLSADSLDIVELTMALEEEFEIGEMQDEDLTNLCFVGELVNYLQTRLSDN